MNVVKQLAQVRSLMEQGCWREAQTQCGRILKKAKGEVDALFLMGMIHGQLAEHEAALECFSEVISINPKIATAHNNLGLSLEALGRRGQAIGSFQEAVRLKGDFFEAYYNLGRALSAAGQYSVAVEALKKAAQINPHHVQVWGQMGLAYSKADCYREAEACFNKALQIKPGDAGLLFNLAHALYRQQAFDASIELLQQLIHSNPEDATLYHALGNVYNDAGQPEQALEYYERTLRLDADFSKAYYDRGLTYQSLGDLDKAIISHREAIRLDPTQIMAYRALATTKKFVDPDDPDLKIMEAVMKNRDLTGDACMHLHFALAKAYEDLKDYDKSFLFYQKGNVAKRASYEYSTEMNRNLFDLFKSLMTEEFFAQRAEYGLQLENEAPIFIVGMPRSGTSLTEQILASHPQVYGAGELLVMQDILQAAIDASPTRFKETISGFQPADFRAFASDYQQQARQNSAGQRYVTDKMPGNFLYIGMIRLMFPQAKVIHCLRDPVDTCLSCYKRYFSGELKFAYDLSELGQYYCLYRDLMNHWQAVLPGFVYDLKYEDLIADQEAQTRQLLTFCGLPWDEQCLNFHQTERLVKTASYAQVRKPIYSSSVKLWKKFEGHLGPLLEQLRQCNTGYDI